MSGDDPNSLGRIALKQVRVSRAEIAARNREASAGHRTKAAPNPRNRLVPYLDLFCRLSDDELARLARAPVPAVEGLRQQIDEVNRGLGRFADLLPRLTDDELARLTGANVKTIRFWRLSQPRHLQTPDGSPAPQAVPRRDTTASHVAATFDPSASDSTARQVDASPADSTSRQVDAPTLTDEDPDESGTFVIDTIE